MNLIIIKFKLRIQEYVAITNEVNKGLKGCGVPKWYQTINPTSMKIPSTPTATAVLAMQGINSRRPPLATPPPSNCKRMQCLCVRSSWIYHWLKNENNCFHQGPYLFACRLLECMGYISNLSPTVETILNNVQYQCEKEKNDEGRFTYNRTISFPHPFKVSWIYYQII